MIFITLTTTTVSTYTGKKLKAEILEASKMHLGRASRGRFSSLCHLTSHFLISVWSSLSLHVSHSDKLYRHFWEAFSFVYLILRVVMYFSFALWLWTCLLFLIVETLPLVYIPLYEILDAITNVCVWNYV